ncbi:MAG: VanW family protein [Spirochaetaceae bacterium]|jgi:vancomycin resistance protein VanW|nr:VanW family protein [Spirochaetaceae bacterium]
MNQFEDEIAKRIYDYESKNRVALSRRFPLLKGPIIFLRRLIRNIQNAVNFKLRYKKKNTYFEHVVARHQSVLRRRLGDSDPDLQEKKIINLRQAVKRLNGIIINQGNIFSFWKVLGQPKYKDGYVDGMLLSNGTVVKGIGGGLCQLSNFLYWLSLHAPVETVERSHHSMDVFPDSGRVLPFGGGATVLYNFIDLQFRNKSPCPLQLKIWITEKHLKGQIVSPHPIQEKYHVIEKNHFFIKRGGQYFRYNELYRETRINNRVIKTEKITVNFAPVLYEVTETYLEMNGYSLVNWGD